MPITPGLIPSPTLFKRGRRSRLLYHWRARDLSLDAVTGQVGTFSRTSPGGMVRDRVNRGWIPVHSQPRWDAPALEAGLLLEYARTNLCTRSQELDVWSMVGTSTVTPNAKVASDGTATGDLISCGVAGPVSCGRARVCTFTGDGTKVCSIELAVGDGSFSTLLLTDVTAGTTRHQVRVTWTAGVPTLSTIAGSGTLFPVVALPDGWYRLSFSAAGVIAANSNEFRVYAGAIGTAVAGNSVYAWGAQVENALYPSSYIPTAASTVGRSADRLTYPCNLSALSSDADDFTLYARFARPSHADATGTLGEFPGVLDLGCVAPYAQFYFESSSRQIVAVLVDAGSAHTTFRSAAIPAGSVIEVLAQIKDLAVAPAIALDVGTGLSAFATAGLNPIAGFGSKIGIGEIGDGVHKLGAPLFEAKIAQGLASMQAMREAF